MLFSKKLSKLFVFFINITGFLALLFFIAIFFTTLGYRSAIQETKIAEVELVTTAYQEFTAKIDWLNGAHDKFNIKGDQFYIDAKILKWNKFASFIGIKTWYELDRIGGRYISIEDEMNKPRTIYNLAEEKDFDIFQLSRKYPMLNYLVESHYGSALYIVVNNITKFDLLVSRTGLTLTVNQQDLNNNNQPLIEIN